MGKKVLVRGYVNYNLGDDLFLEILFNRYPKVDFYLIADKRYKAFKKIPNCHLIGQPASMFMRLLSRVVKVFSSSYYCRLLSLIYYNFYHNASNRYDAYIIIGGSMFKEFSYSKLAYNLDVKAIEGWGRKPSYIISSNFGPYKTVEFLDSYKKIFANFTDVCFRDEYSFGLFQELKNVRNAKDIVFSYPIPDVNTKKRSIGIVMNDFNNHEDICHLRKSYETLIERICIYYTSLAYEITLFGFQSGEEQYIGEFANLVQKKLNYPIQVCIYKEDTKDFIDTYLRQSVIYATRFHALVLSLTLGQDICPIIYNTKMLNLLNDINYKGVMIELDQMQIDVQEIHNALQKRSSELFFVNDSNLQFSALDDFLTAIEN